MQVVYLLRVNMEEKNKIDCHAINQYCTHEIGKLAKMKYEDIPIQERLDAVSMSPMFSFWREVQDTMIKASEEIKRLKEELNNVKISEKLNKQN